MDDEHENIYEYECEFTGKGYQYTSPEERRNQGVPIDSIKLWFPAATVQGKLPRSALTAIWNRYPDPAGSVLKTSSIDVDLVDELPEYACINDAEARNHIRDFGTAFRPVINMALGIQHDDSLPVSCKGLLLEGFREAVLLY